MTPDDALSQNAAADAEDTAVTPHAGRGAVGLSSQLTTVDRSTSPTAANAGGSDPTGADAAGYGRASQARSMVARTIGSAWLWPTLFTAVVTMWHIGRAQMWQDELVTIEVSRRSWRQILRLLHNVDAVHGAYYLFIHEWVQMFGSSPISLRLPSALAMSAGAACVALTGQRLFGNFAGMLGGFGFGLIPAVTRFAQEARSYGLGVLFVAAATLFLLRALERPTLLRWAPYAICVTAIASVNTVALSVLVGHGLGIFTRSGREGAGRRLLMFGTAAVVGVLPVLPIIYLGTRQADQQISWVRHTAPWHVWPQMVASTWAAWAIVVLAVLACVRYRRRAAFPLAVALLPMVAVWLVSLGALSYFFARYLLFCLPAWAVLAGAGLTVVRWKWASVAGLAVLAVLAVPGQLAMRADLSHSWYTYPDPRPFVPLDYRGTANIIKENYRPGDGIIYKREQYWWLEIDTAIPYYLPKNLKLRDIFLSKPAADVNRLNPNECPYSVQCVGTEPRLWLVVPYPTDNPLGELTADQQLVLKPYRQIMIMHPSGMTLALLQQRSLG